MNKIVKWGLMLSLVIGGGLLLGGNVIADGDESSTTGADIVSQSAQVEALQAQAQQLTKQVEAYLAGQATTTAEVVEETKPAERKELSQAELDDIEAQVKVIAAKTEVIKTEVAKIVLIRQISAKIAYLQGEVNALKVAEAKQPEAESATNSVTKTLAAEAAATSTVGVEKAEGSEIASEQNSAVDAQIAAIKAKIKELTAEYEKQKKAEELAGAKEATPEIQCEGGVCSATVNIKPSDTVAETKSGNAEKNGFWQSVGNFIKNLFTF